MWSPIELYSVLREAESALDRLGGQLNGVCTVTITRVDGATTEGTVVIEPFVSIPTHQKETT